MSLRPAVPLKAIRDLAILIPTTVAVIQTLYMSRKIARAYWKFAAYAYI